MKTLWVMSSILALLLSELPASGSGHDKDGAAKPEGTASVSRSEARFSLPLDVRKEWQWFLPGSRENTLEYAWLAEVTNNGKVYQVGYSLFKWPGTSLQRGSLKDLIRAGQVSVWEMRADGNGRGGRRLKDARAQVKPVRDRLVVTVRHRDTFQRLFSAHPKRAVLLVHRPGQGMVRTEVEIHYDAEQR